MFNDIYNLIAHVIDFTDFHIFIYFLFMSPAREFYLGYRDLLRSFIQVKKQLFGSRVERWTPDPEVVGMNPPHCAYTG